MFHSRERNNKINRIQERITCDGKLSSYGELLTKDDSVTIHHRNIRAFATEIYKVTQEMFPPFYHHHEVLCHVSAIITLEELN